MVDARRETEPGGEVSRGVNSSIMFFLIFAVVAVIAPYLVLLVAGYAYSTPMRRRRKPMRWLWALAILVTVLFAAFWLFRSLGITFSQTDPVHTLEP
jgi:drug/metabolite transporter (DMT)-like permease